MHLHVAVCASAPLVKPIRHVRHGSPSIFIFCLPAALFMFDRFPLHATPHMGAYSVQLPLAVGRQAAHLLVVANIAQAGARLTALTVKLTPHCCCEHRSGAREERRCQTCQSRRPLPHPCAGLVQPPQPDFTDIDDCSARDTVRYITKAPATMCVFQDL